MAKSKATFFLTRGETWKENQNIFHIMKETLSNFLKIKIKSLLCIILNNFIYLYIVPGLPSYQVPIFSILESRVNLLLTRQSEHGIVTHYTKYSKELISLIKTANIKRFKEKRYEKTVINFNNFYDYFVLYIFGVSISFGVFLIEILFSKLSRRKMRIVIIL